MDEAGSNADVIEAASADNIKSYQNPFLAITVREIPSSNRDTRFEIKLKRLPSSWRIPLSKAKHRIILY